MIVLDATALDTVHRTRGIGRYVQGLVAGFSALELAGELDFELRLLRTPTRIPDPRNGPFDVINYRRLVDGDACNLFVENRLRIDRLLPHQTRLLHAPAIEGWSTRPWVATCHDLIPLILRGSYLSSVRDRIFWRSYVARLQRQATRVIAISEHTKRTLAEHGVAPDKIDVVNHGLLPFWFEDPDVPEVSPRTRALAGGEASGPAGDRASRPYILFVGGFDPRKNFSRLILALDQMPPSLRPRLLVVGHRAPAIVESHRRIRVMKRIDVTFLEYVSDVDLRFLYHHARCLAFPSHEEGWSFPIVEAMAVGTPVVCADHGSMAEAAGGAAIEADVYRVEEISHAIRAVLEDPSLRRRQIAAGRARAETLSWQRCAQQVSKVYRKALS